jgi:hypothetical protein
MGNIIVDIIKYCLLTLSFISFLIGLRFKNRHKELSHLFLYSISSFLQVLIIGTYGLKKLLRPSIFFIINDSSIHMFIVLEFTCIYFFFLKTSILSLFTKKILVIGLFTGLCTYFILFITLESFVHDFDKIYFWESCLILLPCFIYIYQLFAKPPILDLLKEPSFWFNVGILIFFTLTLPVFFMIDYFENKHLRALVNGINYCGYLIIFSFLIKGYLCKPKVTI